MKLQKLNFRTFAKHGDSMYNLLDTNRERLYPWFWWADKKVTPNKFRFLLFMIAYLIDTKRKEIVHTFDKDSLYDEQFIVYNNKGQIGGMIGLDNIDMLNKDAELWGLAFKGNTQTLESVKMFESYCINELNLDSIYGKVQSSNRASRLFWEKYGYDKKLIERNVEISDQDHNVEDIYTYKKTLTR